MSTEFCELPCVLPALPGDQYFHNWPTATICNTLIILKPQHKHFKIFVSFLLSFLFSD